MSYLRFGLIVAGGDWPVGSVGVLSARSGDLLGVIAYYPAWRQYVFEGKPETVWSAECLIDLTRKLNEMNAERATRLVTRRRERQGAAS